MPLAPSLRQASFRALLLVIAALSWLGVPDRAMAATFGMCADTAQSIAAPAPYFPSTGAEAKPCDEGEMFTWTVPGSPVPQEDVSPGEPSAKRFALVADAFSAPRAGCTKSRTSVVDGREHPEHRWHGLRPPQAS